MRARRSESEYGSFFENCGAKYLSVLMCNDFLVLELDIIVVGTSSNCRAVVTKMCYAL